MVSRELKRVLARPPANAVADPLRGHPKVIEDDSVVARSEREKADEFVPRVQRLEVVVPSQVVGIDPMQRKRLFEIPCRPRPIRLREIGRASCRERV